MIGDYDPVGSELYRYTFVNRCEENGESVPDGNYTIWLSTKGKNASEESQELVNFLKYVDNPKDSEENEDNFINSLKKQIRAIKKDRDWEAKYMLLKEMLKDEREEGRAEGKELTLRLAQLLAEQNRLDDMVKAANDPDYQEKLFKEFNL